MTLAWPRVMLVLNLSQIASRVREGVQTSII